MLLRNASGPFEINAYNSILTTTVIETRMLKESTACESCTGIIRFVIRAMFYITNALTAVVTPLLLW